eukprot:PhF_6_TR40652/c0_g1_i2/m.61056
MRFLQTKEVDSLNELFTDHAEQTQGTSSITYGSLEAYTLKPSKEDRRLTSTLTQNLPSVYLGRLDGSAIDNIITSDNSHHSSSSSNNSLTVPYDIYEDLVCALAHYHGSEYDFTTVPVYAFQEVTWHELECEVNARFTSDPMRRSVFTTLLSVLQINLENREEKARVYSYSDQDDHNPLRDQCVWSRHYFVLCKAAKRMVLLVLQGKSAMTDSVGSEDDDSQDDLICKPPPLSPSDDVLNRCCDEVGESIGDEDLERWASEGPTTCLDNYSTPPVVQYDHPVNQRHASHQKKKRCRGTPLQQPQQHQHPWLCGGGRRNQNRRSANTSSPPPSEDRVSSWCSPAPMAPSSFGDSN